MEKGLPVRTTVRLIAGLLFAVVAAAVTAEEQQVAPVVTRHSIVLAGRPAPYTAEVGRIAIRDVETGAPHGFMFYTAYRIVSAGRPRPLLFVWNGGPGADSATLHFHVAGPKRLVNGALADNPQTWLADADLVFVDPIGTGFSRPAETRFADEFYGTVGDVASVTEFVRAWRVLHAAEDAPLFLAGESWGAGRAASVGYALARRGIPVAGLVLISGGAGLKDSPVPLALAGALRVADYAQTGRFHGKVSPADAAAAERWARLTYAPALERPTALDPAARAQLASGAARYTGLPADRIDAATLKITPRGYRTGLLAAEGKTLSIFDMRLTSSGDDRERAAPLLRYLRHDLGYASSEPYVGLEPIEQGYAPSGTYPTPVGSRWDYATAKVTPEQRAAAYAAAQSSGTGPPQLGPPLPATQELVALEPGVRILVAAGRYDSLNSCAGNEEIGRRLTGPLARAMVFRCYGGGHMMYTDEPARLALGHDIAALVAGRPVPPTGSADRSR